MDSIIQRVKGILLQPDNEWLIIKNETKTKEQLFTGYVLILALIPAVASFIGYGLIGSRSFLGIHYSSFSFGLRHAITNYVNIVISIFLSAWVIRILAPNFSASVDTEKSLKLVAYSYTASMVAGVFYIFPSLSVLAIVGSIYSLVILYKGFKPMTEVPEEKTMSYFLVSLLVLVGISIVVGLIMAGILTTIGLGVMR